VPKVDVIVAALLAGPAFDSWQDGFERLGLLDVKSWKSRNRVTFEAMQRGRTASSDATLTNRSGSGNRCMRA
jgi:hypothetical protein